MRNFKHPCYVDTNQTTNKKKMTTNTLKQLRAFCSQKPAVFRGFSKLRKAALLEFMQDRMEQNDLFAVDEDGRVVDIEHAHSIVPLEVDNAQEPDVDMEPIDADALTDLYQTIQQGIRIMEDEEMSDSEVSILTIYEDYNGDANEPIPNPRALTEIPATPPVPPPPTSPPAPAPYTAPPTESNQNADVIKSEVRTLRQSAVTMSASQKEGASQIISDWLEESSDNENSTEEDNSEKE